MKRREFINWAGLGFIASYFPIALAACVDNADTDNQTSKTTTTNSDNSELISLGTMAKLEETGYLLNEDAKVLVIKDRSDRLRAVNPICTHQGCTVKWQKDSNTLVCPCHNAKFAPDGKVLAKPAPVSLPTYEVKAENGEVLVKIT